MGHEGQEIAIKDTLVFLFAAGLVVPLLRRFGIPAVAGFILAGIALGPAGLGSLSEQWPALGFFTISDPQAAAPFAELGVLFLLFLLGLELSFPRLWALRRVVFGAGGLQCAVSTLLIAAVAWWLGLAPAAAVVVGLALALSSTAIVMQLLIDQRRAATALGGTALGVLLFQDLLVAPILIFVGFAGAGNDQNLLATLSEALLEGLLAIAAIFLIGHFALRRGFRLAAQVGGRDFLMALTLLTVVGAAVITAYAGLSLALGAFLAGLLLGETEFKHQAEVDLEPFKGLLLGLFFMSVGMSIDLADVARLLPYVLTGLAALLVVKFLVTALAVRLVTGDRSVALESAGLLAPAGEFAFVILGAALAGGVLSGDAATLIAAIAGLSMLLIPALDALVRRRTAQSVKTGRRLENTEDYAALKGHVIVAGFGRVGQAIAHVLAHENTELVALDRSVERVSRKRQQGWKVYLGDAARAELLSSAGAAGAAMFIVTVDDPDSAEAMVKAARELRRDAPILARAQDEAHAERLRQAGATFVIPEAIEAGLQMASRALQDFGYDGETARDLIAAARDDEYREGVTAATRALHAENR